MESHVGSPVHDSSQLATRRLEESQYKIKGGAEAQNRLPDFKRHEAKTTVRASFPMLEK